MVLPTRIVTTCIVTFTCNPNISKPVLFKVSLSPIFEEEEGSTSRISSIPEVLKIKKT